MKGKKLLLLVCVVMIWSSTIIFANASSQKIKVLVNGINIGEVGVLFENTTYLPLRKVGESLNAIVEWNSNSKTAVIYDPNVHMFVYNSSNGAETTFGEVSKGFSGKIKIFAQVDNVQFKLNSVKFAIVDQAARKRSFKKLLSIRKETIIGSLLMRRAIALVPPVIMSFAVICKLNLAMSGSLHRRRSYPPLKFI